MALGAGSSVMGWLHTTLVVGPPSGPMAGTFCSAAQMGKRGSFDGQVVETWTALMEGYFLPDALTPGGVFVAFCTSVQSPGASSNCRGLLGSGTLKPSTRLPAGSTLRISCSAVWTMMGTSLVGVGNFRSG